MLIESLGTYLAIRKNESGGTGVLGQSMNGWRITFTACIGNVEDESVHLSNSWNWRS